MPIVRHEIREARWPSAEEARQSLLFQKVRVGAFFSRTRTWVPAMVPWRAVEEGDVTEDLLQWYGRFADGRPGVLVVEATGIRDVPSGPLLRIGHDRFLPGLRKLVEVVRQRSEGQTRLCIQVIDFLRIRRRPPRDRYFREFLALTPQHRERLSERLGDPLWRSATETEVRERLLSQDDAILESILTPREWRDLMFGARESINDLHLKHIAELPKVLPGLFADAAARAREAGFDGVELHYAHAYTMASFLSRLNVRADGYGATPKGRVRLGLEVLEKVRERVGDDYTVGCRLLGDEVIEGGSRVEDACDYSVELARAGVDYLSISKGGKFEDAKQPRVGEAVYPYTGRSGLECMPTVHLEGDPPFGRNLPLARAIRLALHSQMKEPPPVIASGGINSFELAEEALRNGECDLVAAARQSLADPDWWRKMETGRGARIRRCKFTNYCEALDQKHAQVTCQLWDKDLKTSDPHRSDLSVPRSHDGRRRLVAPPEDPG